MEQRKSLPIVPFSEVGEWERWLEGNHEFSTGVWVKLAKKGTGIVSVSYAEAVEVALCFGWIDGQKGAYDERFWLQRFTRRGPRSRWSRINREKAEALERMDRLRPAGLAQVQRARQDGRWDAAYEGQARATVPEDLQHALDRDSEAQAFFAALDATNRYAILYRIQDAKRPETRALRIERFVAMLRAGERIYHNT